MNEYRPKNQWQKRLKKKQEGAKDKRKENN